MSVSVLSVIDLPQLMVVQQDCYSEELVESAAVMSERIAAFSQTCWGYFMDAQMAGYLLAYPSVLGSITPLAAAFPLYQNANCLYLHDMAISADFRGQSLAPELLKHATAEAEKMRLQALALVAVQGAEGYWAKQGFVKVMDITKKQQAILDTYLPEIACYMTKQLRSEPKL
ncbi:MAG: GNAT family N-acetyltransferase [Gammaproteobacteria bacterium]|nr:GNAT family N-acetyltransferase [Gammaproteobacteria bacterium]MBU2058021.1 GNAT family N-acetyltransferase [Gammaproteobacteria bacterium]MBU2174373.1 GNAT family N-acetyltransferase [Gammaproteobacteria bacterium]MBU2247563.1 GNAT family N-acetyltransferase [Gammaproteobacteria bacterium]MBU2346068.1 GNAT family N-acetyltransferase [Gammaproteobacteria bacterium]